MFVGVSWKLVRCWKKQTTTHEVSQRAEEAVPTLQVHYAWTQSVCYLLEQSETQTRPTLEKETTWLGMVKYRTTERALGNFLAVSQHFIIVFPLSLCDKIV